MPYENNRAYTPEQLAASIERAREKYAQTIRWKEEHWLSEDDYQEEARTRVEAVEAAKPKPLSPRAELLLEIVLAIVVGYVFLCYALSSSATEFGHTLIHPW
jgi:hypothetical protein